MVQLFANTLIHVSVLFIYSNGCILIRVGLIRLYFYFCGFAQWSFEL